MVRFVALLTLGHFTDHLKPFTKVVHPLTDGIYSRPRNAPHAWRSPWTGSGSSFREVQDNYPAKMVMIASRRYPGIALKWTQARGGVAGKRKI